MMVPKDGMAARQARGLEGGGGRMDRRKVGRALVLLGAVFLLARNVLWYAQTELPALQEVLADVLQRGPEGALSGEVGRLKTYELLGDVLIDAYLLCATVLVPLLLRGGRERALGPLAAHLLGFSLPIIRRVALTRTRGLLMALGVAALLAGAVLLAGRRPRGGSVPARYGRAASDVATLGLAFLSGVYLYTACCVVANEFYAPGMAVVAGQVGHAVDRGWVALRLVHFVAASALSLLVGVERPGSGGEAGRRGRVALRAAGCAALATLMLRGIAEHYRYYILLPRLQQVTICLCALCLVGEALERAGSRLDGPSRAAPEGDAG